MNTHTFQLRLAEAGYEPGPIDGDLGPKTRAALTAFQQAHGLTPDGEAGLATVLKLVEHRAPVQLDAVGERNLARVHPDLQRVVRRALAAGEISFTVTEGTRSLTKQKNLVAAGASRTLRSRHLTGHAVDLAVKVGGRIRWDWPLYERLALSVKAAAADLGIPVEWGGDWRTFKDGPHFQLPLAVYPGPAGSGRLSNA